MAGRVAKPRASSRAGGFGSSGLSPFGLGNNSLDQVYGIGILPSPPATTPGGTTPAQPNQGQGPANPAMPLVNGKPPTGFGPDGRALRTITKPFDSPEVNENGYTWYMQAQIDLGAQIPDGYGRTRPAGTGPTDQDSPDWGTWHPGATTGTTTRTTGTTGTTGTDPNADRIAQLTKNIATMQGYVNTYTALPSLNATQSAALKTDQATLAAYMAELSRLQAPPPPAPTPYQSATTPQGATINPATGQPYTFADMNPIMFPDNTGTPKTGVTAPTNSAPTGQVVSTPGAPPPAPTVAPPRDVYGNVTVSATGANLTSLISQIDKLSTQLPSPTRDAQIAALQKQYATAIGR